MSISDRLDQGAQVGADRWREGMSSVSWGGGLAAVVLLAAGIAAILYVHAAVGIPLVVISLIVLWKSGFRGNYTPSD